MDLTGPYGVGAHRVDIALGNLESGGLERGFAPGLHGSRGYNIDRLLRLFEPLRATPPALIGLCEGKEWTFWGDDAGNAHVNALARFMGRPYVIEYGHLDRGPSGPVTIYDPTVLRIDVFNRHDGVGVWTDNVNLAKFHLAADEAAKLWFKGEHLDYIDGDRRLATAKRNNALSDVAVPVVLWGDLNSTASGPHLPQRDWEALPMHKRVHKAWQPGGPGTPWVADTRAVDHLIGTWTDGTRGEPGRRVDGLNFHAACELAHFLHGMDPERAFKPTVNQDPRHSTGEFINDWALLNNAAAPLLIPDTYTVHLHDGAGPPPSDHGLITLSLAL